MAPLYFSFPDGLFDYVCAECTALCCRGQGFSGSLEREMGRLVTLYPNLESAVVERQGAILSFATPTGGCYFLDGDDLCRIEKEHGRALKPGLCLVFPFNSFSLIGKTLVVSPHFMCPLRLRVPARPGEVKGTHADLEALLRETGIMTDSQMTLSLVPARLHHSQGATSVLAREAAFRDRCGAAVGVGSFSACLRGAAGDAARLEENVSRGAALLGLQLPLARERRDDIDDILLAVAPTLRLRLLRLPADGILLALTLAEQVARRLIALSPAPPTPRGVMHLIESVIPALHLLGCADVPVSASRRGRPKAPRFGDPALVFAGYRVLRGLEGGGSILDVLEDGMQRLSTVADQNAFLVAMGTLIGPAPRPRRKKSAGG